MGLTLAQGMKRLEGVKPPLLLADSAHDAEGPFWLRRGRGFCSFLDTTEGGGKGEEEEEQLAADLA